MLMKLRSAQPRVEGQSGGFMAANQKAVSNVQLLSSATRHIIKVQ